MQELNKLFFAPAVHVAGGKLELLWVISFLSLMMLSSSSPYGTMAYFELSNKFQDYEVLPHDNSDPSLL